MVTKVWLARHTLLCRGRVSSTTIGITTGSRSYKWSDLTMMIRRAASQQASPVVGVPVEKEEKKKRKKPSGGIGGVKITETHTLTSDGKWSLPTFLFHPTTTTPQSQSQLVPTTVRKDDKDTHPPLLLISGWTGVAADWGAIPKMIASKTGRVVITYDPRGLGFSKRLSVPVSEDGSDINNNEPSSVSTLDVMVDDAKQVAKLCLGQFSESPTRDEEAFSSPAIPSASSSSPPAIISLAGVSMGGMIAQQLVADTLLLSSSLSSKSNSNSNHNERSNMQTPADEHTQSDSVRPNKQTSVTFSSQSQRMLEIESLILIATTPGGTKVRSSTQKNFFRAFQDWSDEKDTDDSSASVSHNDNDNNKVTISSYNNDNKACAERFFVALGETYQGCATTSTSSRRSKQVIRQRLIAKFLDSRDQHFTEGNNSVKEGIQWQLQALRTKFDSSAYLPEFAARTNNNNTIIPSLIVHGTDDSVIPLEDATRMHKLLASSSSSSESLLSSTITKQHQHNMQQHSIHIRHHHHHRYRHALLCEIPNCDHMCWLTHPLELLEPICDFLNAQTSNIGTRPKK
jgi:pimeloyl-ACP methyl ester carboxylesterase